MFNLEQALAQTTRNLAERAKKRTLSYVLYYSNNERQPEGKIQGFTIKQLVGEFRALGRGYRYAFITKVNDDSVLRFYNAQVSKKFYSMTRKGPTAKK